MKKAPAGAHLAVMLLAKLAYSKVFITSRIVL